MGTPGPVEAQVGVTNTAGGREIAFPEDATAQGLGGTGACPQQQGALLGKGMAGQRQRRQKEDLTLSGKWGSEACASQSNKGSLLTFLECLLCTQHRAKCFTQLSHSLLREPYAVELGIQMRKLRHRGGPRSRSQSS